MADLEFAARIGKILLDHNQELELHCGTLQSKITEQEGQIQHLEKQLNILRDLEEQRCKVYDQLQHSCSEFEKENILLAERHKAATSQIERLTKLSDEQEEQLSRLSQEVADLKV